MHKEIISRVAECSAMLRKQWKRGRFGARLKNDGSVLSDFDVGIERKLALTISRWEPDALVIGEEREHPNAETTARARVIYAIDPIDGTFAFTSGGFSFAITVTRFERDGRLEACIALPAFDQLLIVDASGVRQPRKPAFRKLQAHEQFVATDQVLADSKLHRAIEFRFPGRVRSYGSVVHHAVEVARGRFAASLWLGGNPYDTLPIFALMRSVGGDVAVHGDRLLTAEDILAQRYSRSEDDQGPVVLIAGHRSVFEPLARYFPYRKRP